jgi:hypothetical protein
MLGLVINLVSAMYFKVHCPAFCRSEIVRVNAALALPGDSAAFEGGASSICDENKNKNAKKFAQLVDKKHFNVSFFSFTSCVATPLLVFAFAFASVAPAPPHVFLKMWWLRLENLTVSTRKSY